MPRRRCPPRLPPRRPVPPTAAELIDQTATSPLRRGEPPGIAPDRRRQYLSAAARLIDLLLADRRTSIDMHIDVPMTDGYWRIIAVWQRGAATATAAGAQAPAAAAETNTESNT